MKTTFCLGLLLVVTFALVAWSCFIEWLRDKALTEIETLNLNIRECFAGALAQKQGKCVEGRIAGWTRSLVRKHEKIVRLNGHLSRVNRKILRLVRFSDALDARDVAKRTRTTKHLLGRSSGSLVEIGSVGRDSTVSVSAKVVFYGFGFAALMAMLAIALF